MTVFSDKKKLFTEYEKLIGSTDANREENRKTKYYILGQMYKMFPYYYC